MLRQPAHAAARAVARVRLERALEKAAPLLVMLKADAGTTIGNEEVHDFRVAVRRLRSWLRAADDLLHEDIPRSDRAALRRIARCAGAARDAQVQWQWLTAPGEPFSAGAARAAQWLAAERLRTYVSAREALQRLAAARWAKLTTALAATLAPSGDGTPPPAAETLGAHLSPVLVRHVAVARRALDRVEHRTQVEAIHRARIKVKRLRYLVEAVDAPSARVTRTVRFLRSLQDSLGELHDAHVFAQLMAPHLDRRKARRRADAPRPSLRDLRALRAALRRRELAAFRRSLDLVAAPDATAAWRVSTALIQTLSAGRSARHFDVRSAAASALAAKLKHAPAHR